MVGLVGLTMARLWLVTLPLLHRYLVRGWPVQDILTWLVRWLALPYVGPLRKLTRMVCLLASSVLRQRFTVPLFRAILAMLRLRLSSCSVPLAANGTFVSSLPALRLSSLALWGLLGPDASCLSLVRPRWHLLLRVNGLVSALRVVVSLSLVLVSCLASPLGLAVTPPMTWLSRSMTSEGLARQGLGTLALDLRLRMVPMVRATCLAAVVSCVTMGSLLHLVTALLLRVRRVVRRRSSYVARWLLIGWLPTATFLYPLPTCVARRTSRVPDVSGPLLAPLWTVRWTFLTCGRSRRPTLSWALVPRRVYEVCRSPSRPTLPLNATWCRTLGLLAVSVPTPVRAIMLVLRLVVLWVGSPESTSRSTNCRPCLMARQSHVLNAFLAMHWQLCMRLHAPFRCRTWLRCRLRLVGSYG